MYTVPFFLIENSFNALWMRENLGHNGFVYRSSDKLEKVLTFVQGINRKSGRNLLASSLRNSVGYKNVSPL